METTRTKSILFTALATLVLSACGTTHHFVPGRPLDKGEYSVNITWHYDFNNLQLPDLIPDVHAYTGAGKNYNLGLGYRMPFYISHGTVLKYWENGSDGYWMAYFHLNQVLGINNNPYLEAGASYIAHQSTYHQSFSLGVSAGDGMAWPLVMGGPSRGNRRLRLMPTARYVVAGREFGFSVSHYHGLTNAAYESHLRILMAENDTTMVIPAETVDSVALITVNERRFSGSGYGVFLNTGDTVIVWRPLHGFAPDGTGFAVLMMIPPERQIENLIPSEFAAHRIGRTWAHTYLRYEDALGLWRRGEDIVVQRYPDELLTHLEDRARSTCSWWRDNSIGISVVNEYRD